MVDEDYIKGIPTIHIEDTPLIDFFHEVGKYYSKADVIALSIDNDKAKLNVGDIKKKDIAYNYRYTGGEISVYEVTGKDLKKYMEWAAGYFNTLNPGDITPSFNPKDVYKRQGVSSIKELLKLKESTGEERNTTLLLDEEVPFIIVGRTLNSFVLSKVI